MKGRKVSRWIALGVLGACLAISVVFSQWQGVDEKEGSGKVEKEEVPLPPEPVEKIGPMVVPKQLLQCHLSGMIHTQFDPEVFGAPLFYAGELIEGTVRLSVRQGTDPREIPRTWYQDVRLEVQRERQRTEGEEEQKPVAELCGKPGTTTEPPLYGLPEAIRWETVLHPFRLRNLTPTPTGERYTIQATLTLQKGQGGEEGQVLLSEPVPFVYKQPTSKREWASVELRQAIRERGEKKFKACEDRLHKLLKDYPRSSNILGELGRAALAQGKYQGAVVYLERALAANPEGEAIYSDLYRARRKLAKSKKQGSP